MATLVFFHAHPDDECTSTGGSMAMASDAGHRVVLVTATKGELGEVQPGVLDEGEALEDRRVVELADAARVLGVHRSELLGYRDSGMVDTPPNEDPRCFWQADVEEAAERLARILREEQADVLTVYDDHGNYGHPDHIQVHRVGVRAGEIAGTPLVLQATMNRTHMKAVMAEAPPQVLDEAEVEGGADGPRDPAFFDTLGEPEERITHAVDVSAYATRKRAGLRCHRTQISEESFFLKMPDEMFAASFGREWFVAVGDGHTAGPGGWATTFLPVGERA